MLSYCCCLPVLQGRQVRHACKVHTRTVVPQVFGLPSRFVSAWVALQAGTTFKVLIRSAVPLTQTLAAQKANLPRPYSRVVFILGYADTPLLHSIEAAVRTQNVRCLGLHKTPAGTSSRNRAASVYGAASKAPGQAPPLANMKQAD